MIALNDLLALSHVPRWSIVPHLRPQSVAEHSFRVACIARELCRLVGCSSIAENAIEWAILHDAVESRTGDIPGTVKFDKAATELTAMPGFEAEMRKFFAVEFDMVKMADLIETATYIVMYGVGEHARRVGDSLLRQVWEKAETVATAHSYPQLMNIVENLITTITSEEGRFEDYRRS